MANAGIASNGTVAVTPVEALVRVIEVNLAGVVRTVSATLATSGGSWAAFDRMLAKLPGPFGSMTSVQECAAAFVEWIERRSRTVFVPCSLGPLAAVRQLFSSPLSDWATGRSARRIIPRLEGEVRALGRSFVAHSVEAAGRGERPAAEG